MAYTSINFPSKKALKEAVAAGQKITVWSPGPFPVTANGTEYIEGPQYPQPHKFYCTVTLKDGIIITVK